jgi:hypothetical protein
VRKTAGTSIVFAFFSLSKTDPYRIERRLYRVAFARVGGVRFVGYNPPLIQGGDYFFATSHFPSYVARPPVIGTYSFTALRDPLRRITSLYKYLKSEKSDEGFTFRAPAAERSWAKGSFGAFLDAVPRTVLLQQLYMFSPDGGVSETVDVLGRMNLVMHTESLTAGIDALRERTGVSLEIRHERTSAVLEFPEPELERARAMLAPEYEMLRQLNL